MTAVRQAILSELARRAHLTPWDRAVLMTARKLRDGSVRVVCWWSVMPVWRTYHDALGYAVGEGATRAMAEAQVLRAIRAMPEIAGAA